MLKITHPIVNRSTFLELLKGFDEIDSEDSYSICYEEIMSYVMTIFFLVFLSCSDSICKDIVELVASYIRITADWQALEKIF